MNKLIHGDCLEVMKDIPAGSIDLTVTSPPYDNLRNYNDSLDWGPHIWEPVIEQLFRVTKKGGAVVWVVGDATIKGSETGTSFKQALHFMESGFNLHDTMIYQKDSISFPDTNRYYQIFEYMFVFSKEKPKTTNLFNDRKNKYGGKILKGGERQKNGELLNRRKGNVLKDYGIRYNIWTISTGKNKSTVDNIGNCPAIMPEKLANDHINSWSNPNDTILDPFLGSGTTGKMSVLNNRNFIGIEKELEYFEIAKKRIESAESQLRF